MELLECVLHVNIQHSKTFITPSCKPKRKIFSIKQIMKILFIKTHFTILTLVINMYFKKAYYTEPTLIWSESGCELGYQDPCASTALCSSTFSLLTSCHFIWCLLLSNYSDVEMFPILTQLLPFCLHLCVEWFNDLGDLGRGNATIDIHYYK